MNGYEVQGNDKYASFDHIDDNQNESINSHSFVEDINPVPFVKNVLSDTYEKISNFHPIDKIKNSQLYNNIVDTNLDDYYASSKQDQELRNSMSPQFKTDFVDDIQAIGQKINFRSKTTFYFLIVFLLIMIVLFYCKKM